MKKLGLLRGTIKQIVANGTVTERDVETLENLIKAVIAELSKGLFTTDKTVRAAQNGILNEAREIIKIFKEGTGTTEEAEKMVDEIIQESATETKTDFVGIKKEEVEETEVLKPEEPKVEVKEEKKTKKKTTKKSTKK